MHLLVYEYLTGGGLLHGGIAPAVAESLAREGAAMVRAVADDFLRLSNTRVSVLHDARFTVSFSSGCQISQVANGEEQQSVFATLCRAADFTLIIAPEFDGVLTSLCRLVESLGSGLLSPDSEFVQLCSDKLQTNEQLALAGVPVPHSVAIGANEALPDRFPYPAVLKPRDGAGSVGVTFVPSADSGLVIERANGDCLLQQFCPGVAASVALLCGPKEYVALPACLQRLSADGRFRYLGGSLPVEPSLDRRARRLASAALDALPRARGYVGVDLVLGADGQGREDYVIEVNPRLTTSYVGLRAAACGNVAGAMIEIAEGRPAELLFSPRPIEFTAEGGVIADGFQSAGMLQ